MNKQDILVYQIPLDESGVAASNWINLNFDSAVGYGFNVAEGSYECVFDGSVNSMSDTYELLDYIREYTDEALPEFSGRPISTSDLIVVGVDWYYVGSHSYTLFEISKYI